MNDYTRLVLKGIFHHLEEEDFNDYQEQSDYEELYEDDCRQRADDMRKA